MRGQHLDNIFFLFPKYVIIKRENNIECTTPSSSQIQYTCSLPLSKLACIQLGRKEYLYIYIDISSLASRLLLCDLPLQIACVLIELK